MSKNAMDVDHQVEGRALKRQRENTAGGSVGSAIKYSTPAGSAAPARSGQPHADWPAGWRDLTKDIPAARIPPPNALAYFIRTYKESLAGYDEAARKCVTAVRLLDKFNAETEGGTTPAVVLNAVKPPQFSWPEVLKDEGVKRTTEARETLVAALAPAIEAAVTYHRLVLETHVQVAKEHADPKTRSISLALTLQAYCEMILAGAPDKTIWNDFSNAVVAACGAELETVRIDAIARARTQALDSEAKRTSVALASAKAELENSTKDLDTIVAEKVKAGIADALAQQAEKENKPSKKQGTKQAANPKNPDTASSSRQQAAPSTTKTQSKKKAPATNAAQKSADAKKTEKGGNGGGNGGGKGKQPARGEKKKKGKAKTKSNESSDEEDEIEDAD